MECNERILLASPHMGGDERNYIDRAFDTNWVAPLGANVTGFERDICDYTHAKAATALSSGTAALHLALLLVGVGRGDTVFCQDLTFSASANPIKYVGATPVFIDSEPQTWNMSPEALDRAIAMYGAPKAAIFVHLYGTPARTAELLDICRARHVTVIEDAAEALGSTYHGQSCGAMAEYGALSFNGNKIITTSGGGMLLCQDTGDAAHALKLATQARENAPWYQHEEIGYNYRLSNICAGIGRGQMRVLEQRIAQKREIFDRYRAAFEDLPVHWAQELPGCRANRWLSVMMLDDDARVTPAQILDALERENIEGRYMWKPMHMQPVFSDCSYVTAGDRSVSEELFRCGVCLPSDTKMTQAQQERVIAVIRRLFSHCQP